MKNIKILKSIFTIIIIYIILALISFLAKNSFGLTLKDSFFIIGVVSFIIDIMLNFSGDSMGLSIKSLGNINSQYVSRVDLESKNHEYENNKPKVNFRAIINSTLFFSSIFIIFTSCFL